jgi:hypothetical protein
MNQLEIIFTGIVYLLGTSSPQAPGKVEVILPNFSSAAAPFGHVIPEHYAYLKVDIAQLDDYASLEVERPPDIVYKRDGTEWAVFLLDGETISINTTGTEVPTPLELCRASCGSPFRMLSHATHAAPGKSAAATKMTLSSYSQVAHKDEICRDCAKPVLASDPVEPLLEFDDRFLSKVSPLVAARLTLTTGKLSSLVMPTPLWKFLPTSARYSTGRYQTVNARPLADAAVLQSTSTGAYSLVLTKPQRTPVSITFTSDATAEIGNMPLDDVLGLTTRVAAETVDHHFALYYLMFKAPRPVDPPVPHMEMSTWPVYKAGGPRHNCPPLADETPAP